MYLYLRSISKVSSPTLVNEHCTRWRYSAVLCPKLFRSTPSNSERILSAMSVVRPCPLGGISCTVTPSYSTEICVKVYL